MVGGGGISDTALVCSLLDSVTGPRPLEHVVGRDNEGCPPVPRPIGPLGHSLLWDPSEGQQSGLGCDPPCPYLFLPLLSISSLMCE